jgi:hypothetical protein
MKSHSFHGFLASSACPPSIFPARRWTTSGRAARAFSINLLAAVPSASLKGNTDAPKVSVDAIFTMYVLSL